jgi:hypothetical protein
LQGKWKKLAVNQRFLKISSFCLIGSASAASAASGIADTLSTALFAAAFAAGWFFDTARLRRLLPARFFAFAAIVYLCFTPVDYFLLSPDWQRVTLHAIWFAVAVKLTTRADDKDWPSLYLTGSIQWVLAAAWPTATIFWICFAAFIVSGVSALMLFELRRLARIFHRGSTAATQPGMSTALRLFGRLDISSNMPSSPSRRAPCIHARLRRLATNPHEISGLRENAHLSE